MACPVSRTSVNQQDNDIIVKSIDQNPNSCESRVQSTVQSSPKSRYCSDPFNMASFEFVILKYHKNERHNEIK